MNIFLILTFVGLSYQGALVTLKEDADTKDIRPCKSDDILSCTVAEVDLKAFDDDVLSVPGCDNMKQKNVIQEDLSRGKDFTKSVDYVNDDGCEAVFSFRKGKVFGDIDAPKGNFVLEPCAAFKGCHVWKEEDMAKFNHDEDQMIPDPDADRALATRNWGASNALRQQGIDDNTTIVTYSVKYYYTREFAEVTDDIELYMDQVTAETNQGYINSLIPVRIKIHCIEAADMNDMADGRQQIYAFRDLKGNSEALRGGADAAALLVKRFNYCGIGYVDSWRTGNTLTAQTKGCALGYFTLGHELGHNFGCLHDRYSSSGGRYPYNFGSFIGDGPYRTCMAYSRSGYNRKANIYSSPVAKFEGIVTGTATEDNARVIRENRFGMAAVGDEQGSCDWQFSSTAKPPATTEIPTTTEVPTTTDVPGTTQWLPQACRQENVYYEGTIRQIGRWKTAKNANRCERKCKRRDFCAGWTYFPANVEDKEFKKRCLTFTSVEEVRPIEDYQNEQLLGTISGTPSMCT